jgi:sugar phosphate permease
MPELQVVEGKSGHGWLPRFMRPPTGAQPITDPTKIEASYAYHRPRILFWSTAGYATFYFVRKNLPVAMPLMMDQLGLSKTAMGIVITVHGVTYGVSKFLNGIIADRANARFFMALALIAAAIINVCFGMSTTIFFFGLFWILNGWFQGMGYPPCARLLSHWFSPKELATKMSYWNASHAFGGGGILILCGWLVVHYGWQSCFYVPAVIALAVAGLLLANLRDTPESVGLPPVAGTRLTKVDEVESTVEFKQFLWDRVFSNKYIWLVSIANFFVYTIRFAAYDWGPTLLKETKGIEIEHAAWMIAGFEFAGLAGMLVTGYLTDRVFRGRAVPLCLICMLLCGLSIFLFWQLPPHHMIINETLLCLIGFFVYGPQALVAVVVVNLATKRAAATAVGLTSIFGYASTVLSGYGLGWLVQHHGWPPAFAALIGIAAVGAMFFAAALPAKASSYAE